MAFHCGLLRLIAAFGVIGLPAVIRVCLSQGPQGILLLLIFLSPFYLRLSDASAASELNVQSDEEESVPFGTLVSPMTDPGPDLANFPNSSVTLKPGGFYIETAPLSYYGSSPDVPSQWNLSYLFRYGLVENVELRVFSNGLTFRSGETGTSPIAIDTKAHLGDFKNDSFNASVGVEAYVAPPNWLATSDFRQPFQYSVTLLMDHDLPWDISFEWNLGVVRQLGMGLSRTRPTVQWAFQRDIVEGVAAFIQGFHNASTLPGVPTSQLALLYDRQVDVVGFGSQWIVNQRFSVYGNINFGITSLSPKQIAIAGFAVAF